MRVSVGIDIAKEFHWVTAIDDRQRRAARPPGRQRAGRARSADRGDRRAGAEHGPAARRHRRARRHRGPGWPAMLAEAGFALVHVPGLAVNRARQGTVGGEHKSDPRDARTIAEQVRTARRPAPDRAATETRCRDPAAGRPSPRPRRRPDPAPRRLRDLLASIFPGPGARLDPTKKAEPAAAQPLCHPGRDPPRRPARGSSITSHAPATCADASRSSPTARSAAASPAASPSPASASPPS